MVGYLLVWVPVVWIPIESPKMKGIVILRVYREKNPKPPTQTNN